MSTYCKELSSIVREVRTNAVVTGVAGYSDPKALPAVVSALWDTGAWSSVVTQKVVTALGLSPIDHVRACGVNGWYDAPVYIVDVTLPNKIKNTNITQGEGQHIPRGQRPSCEAGASGVTRNALQVSFLFGRI